MGDTTLVGILEGELRAFKGRCQFDADGTGHDGDFWFCSEVPDIDFNRDIVAPGASVTFPDGAIGIYVDENFWDVAALPLRFIDLPLPRVVAILWPDVTDPEFGEDRRILAPKA